MHDLGVASQIAAALRQCEAEQPDQERQTRNTTVRLEQPLLLGDREIQQLTDCVPERRRVLDVEQAVRPPREPSARGPYSMRP